jgi:hypothetical protein
VETVVFIVAVILGRAEVSAPPPIVIKDMQLAVLVAHIATMTRRLANAQWRGQATVAKAEAE